MTTQEEVQAYMMAKNLSGADFTNIDLNISITTYPLIGVRTGPMIGADNMTLPNEYSVIETSNNEYYIVGPGVDLYDADLKGISLKDKDMTSVDFTKTSLENVNMRNTDISGATIYKTISGPLTSALNITLPNNSYRLVKFKPN